VPLKVEFHAHTADDPQDVIPHSSCELIDRAAALGYDALAITLHDRQLDLEPLRDHAAARGVVLIPGIERAIQGKHVLLLNFAEGAEDVNDFDDVAELKARDRAGLVIAPHPFYPSTCALGRRLMDRYKSVFDAVELHGMYMPGANFNEKAVRWAAANRKPLVGSGDVHRLAQLGSTYSFVEADPEPGSICEAVRAGRVEVRTSPLGRFQAITLFGDLFVSALLAGNLWRGLSGASAPRKTRAGTTPASRVSPL
jgi:predicted metal-dependent phosphoesterase TrpH